MSRLLCPQRAATEHVLGFAAAWQRRPQPPRPPNPPRAVSSHKAGWELAATAPLTCLLLFLYRETFPGLLSLPV